MTPTELLRLAKRMDLGNAYLWWGIECDEFAWFAIVANHVEQILHINKAREKYKYRVFTWDGTQIQSRTADEMSDVFKIEETE